MAKERGLADIIKAQILIYPATAPPKCVTESSKLFGNEGYALENKSMEFFDNAYWGDCEKTKMAFPLVATKEELVGLPPALIFIAEADILRDEGEQYARQLIEADVPVAAVRVIGAGEYFKN